MNRNFTTHPGQEEVLYSVSGKVETSESFKSHRLEFKVKFKTCRKK